MRFQGFTLIELLFSMSLLSIVGLLAFVAVMTSAESAAVASAEDIVQQNLRDTMTLIAMDIPMASKTANEMLDLDAIAVVENPVAGSPVELVFQTPLDNQGAQWSTPIRLRFVNEDANSNGILDEGEDLDGDGLLTRRLMRIQDRNSNGNTSEPGEAIPLGSANELSNVEFILNADGNMLTVALSASKQIDPRRISLVTGTLSRQFYIMN